MRILILGGSNASPASGWGAEFGRLAQDHVVVNRFLGAAGAVFGVVRLMKMEREREPAPDLLILEYLLNDILIHTQFGLDREMLADALRSIASHCRKRGIRLVALCLEPRLGELAAQDRAGAVREIYRSVLGSRGVPIVSAADAMGRTLESRDYADDQHLSPDVSTRIAAHLLDVIGRGSPIVPWGRARDISAFAFVDATEARYSGAAERAEIQASVFSGPSLRLSRPSNSQWPGRGQVVGLVLRSDPTSGYYRIGAEGRFLRKNAFSSALERLPRAVLLHHLGAGLLAKGEVAIDMPAEETDRTAIPLDPTFLEWPPAAASAAQTVEVAGVVLWRRPGRLRRAVVAAVVDGLGWPLWWNGDVLARAWRKMRTTFAGATRSETMRP